MNANGKWQYESCTLLIGLTTVNCCVGSQLLEKFSLTRNSIFPQSMNCTFPDTTRHPNKLWNRVASSNQSTHCATTQEKKFIILHSSGPSAGNQPNINNSSRKSRLCGRDGTMVHPLDRRLRSWQGNGNFVRTSVPRTPPPYKFSRITICTVNDFRLREHPTYAASGRT